jgi:hypothetical protein
MRLNKSFTGNRYGKYFLRAQDNKTISIKTSPNPIKHDLVF